MLNEERTPTIRVRTVHLPGELVRLEAELSLARRAEGVVVAHDVVGEWDCHGG